MPFRLHRQKIQNSPTSPRGAGGRCASLRFAAALATAALATGLACAGGLPGGEKKTVCTITVNSPDEKETFRKALGPGQYEFVELVEHGRHDWLESACRTGIRCDMLVISGHYDGGNEFFSDRTEAREFLPVDELERVSCSESCPGLFSRLKEVYLFGCNTLNPEPNAFPSAEIGRSLERAGLPRGEAERMTRKIAERHAESSKDRMRLIFRDVPAIYGFSSVAPLGPVAGSILQRHLAANGTGDVATGRPSGRLLNAFSAHAMTVTSGLRDSDPKAGHRRDVCQFADERLAPAQKVAFVHSIFEREAAEARMFLPRLERFAATLDDSTRSDPAVAAALQEIAADDGARTRYLDLARDADSASVRARMIALAENFGWLSAERELDELTLMWNEQLAGGTITPAEVDLACSLNAQGKYDTVLPVLERTPAMLRVPQAAVLACLGSAGARELVLRALTSADERDVAYAQAYLRHRPLDEGDEWRDVMADIASARAAPTQARALHALAHQRLSDPDSLHELVRLYPLTESVGVQTAIAGILLRSDYQAIASPDVIETLRTRRVSTGAATQDVIDVLIRRMQPR